MSQDGKATGAAPPFATKDGKPVSTGGNEGGARDFTRETNGGSGAGGGRDFSKESRPQSEAKAEVIPNSQEIPKGGKILLADPGPVSAKVSGTAQHAEKKPFRV
jgi:hypothetical protein